MKSLILSIATFLVSVCGYIDEWNLVQTRKSYDDLFECMLSNNGLWDGIRDIGNIRGSEIAILEALLYEFRSHTMHTLHFNRTLTLIMTDLVRRDQLSRVQATQVRVSITNAFMDCVNETRRDLQNEAANQPEHQNVPDFRFQSSQVSDLLNLVLVDSIGLLEHPDGLATLLSFARNALQAFESDARLSSFRALRYLWQILAESFFDFSAEAPFMRYTYSMNSSAVYTRDDPGLFSFRAGTSYGERNPAATRQDISRVWRLHPFDRNNRHRDVFYLPGNRVTITEADIYYEIQESRFFRAIFFCLELVERGYADFYGNFLTDRPIPEDLTRLLRDETYYGPYFETTRVREIYYARPDESSDANEFLHFMRRSESAIEPVVVRLFYYRLRFLITTTAVPTSTTVSSVGASSTSESEEFYNEIDQAARSGKDHSQGRGKSDDEDNENCNYNDPEPDCCKCFKNLQPVDEEKPLDFFQGIFSTMLITGIMDTEELICQTFPNFLH